MRKSRVKSPACAGSVLARVLAVAVLLWPIAVSAQELIWGRQFGTDVYDDASDVAIANDGSVYVLGITYGSLDSANAASELRRSDAYLRKYDSYGKLVWRRQFGYEEREFPSSTAIDAAGDIIVAGSTEALLDGTPTPGVFNGFLRKYNASGDIVWFELLGPDEPTSLNGIATDPASNIYVVGDTGPYFSLNTFLTKYDASGNVVWLRQFQTDVSDGANGLAIDRSGNLYVVGLVRDFSSSAGPDAFLRKYSNLGNLRWSRQFGTIEWESAADIAVDGNGNLFVAGTTTGSLHSATAGSNDAFLRMYNSSGSLLWGRQFGTPEPDTAWAVAVDGNGEVYISGETWGSLDSTLSGLIDAFVRRYSPEGDVVWARQFGSTARDSIGALAVGDDGKIYIAGRTRGGLHAPNAVSVPTVDIVDWEDVFLQ